MDLATTFATYSIVWWVVLFTVLPMGVQSHAEAGVKTPGGGDPASPVNPRLGRKFITTTWVSALVFAVLWLVVRFGHIDLTRLPGPHS